MIHLALFGIDAGMGALLTYLVHSTAWIAAALLLTRAQRLSPAARHAVWRATVVGPLASSALALGLGHRWQWALTGPSSSAGASAPAAALPLAGTVELVGNGVGASAPLAIQGTQPWSWSTLLATGWAVVALLGVLLLARGAARQRRALEPRTPITDAACIEVLEQVAQRAGLRHRVRLSCCAAARTPLVLNAREVCLPARAVELDRSALESVLAHELAHIERHDALWLNGALLLQVLMWFQPLHRKARAELQATAELAADDRAVELTGDALGLARTLTQVASWVSGARFVPSVAMARADSPIVERVERLIEADTGAQACIRSRRPWLVLAALATIGAGSPSVGAPQAAEPQPTLAPAALERAADTGNARRGTLSDADREYILQPIRTSLHYWREEQTLQSVLCEYITEAEFSIALAQLTTKHPDNAWGEALDVVAERFLERFAQAGNLATERQPPRSGG
jgi:beta-lactamase regulating signal transducer with metallopeptidase domain